MKVPEIAWLLAAKEGENIEFKKAEHAFEFDELMKYACVWPIAVAVTLRSGFRMSGRKFMSGILNCFFGSITMQVTCKLPWGDKVSVMTQMSDIKRFKKILTCMMSIATCKFDAINAAIQTQS